MIYVDPDGALCSATRTCSPQDRYVQAHVEAVGWEPATPSASSADETAQRTGENFPLYERPVLE
jgi:hypothetical protein